MLSSTSLKRKNSEEGSFKKKRFQIIQQRRSLPIFKSRGEIVNVINQEKCIIFLGDTACGKTTQIPQYILENGIVGNKVIAVTQPRRVAAITIAERVAFEVGCELGQKVGYSVRFDDKTSSSTKIKYVTDGMLLRESIGDPLLQDYSVIILDEAHERTLHTDLLFGVVKSAQAVREKKQMSPLKVIIMSATMDHEHYSKYFNDAPVYFLKGREYNIKIYSTTKKQEDYVHSALVTVLQINENEDKGDILVFCTGEEEIKSMISQIQGVLSFLPVGCPVLVPYPLYAALPSSHQLKAFEPVSPGCRKVIFSTNIAETSVTIPGIKYVVDTGMVKERIYDAACGMDILKIQQISKAQAEQRCGRAGREFDGSYYRLFTEEEYESFKEYNVPEIQRCNLLTAVLQIVAIGIHDIRSFDFMDKPSDENINDAIWKLKLLNAVEEDEEGNLNLTECGKVMVNFPLDPKYSKALITSKTMRCTQEILSIISLLSVESIFFIPENEEKKAAKIRKKFDVGEGDHILLLNVYRAFRRAKENVIWCHENFINYKNMKKAVKIRKQLSTLCQKNSIPITSCDEMWKVRKCLLSGFYINCAKFQGDKVYKTLVANEKVHIHPTSCMFHSFPTYCIYTELIQTTKSYMRNISPVEDSWLGEIESQIMKR